MDPADPIVASATGSRRPVAPRGLRWEAARGAWQRQQVEHYVRQRFARMHGATVTSFMPCLWTLRSADDEIVGAVGVRPAAEGPLFLERYLDVPIEAAIAARVGRCPPREAIVEVGNLAADGAGSARALIVGLASLLAQLQVRWVGFTGTPALVNSFHRLGLRPLHLAPADPSRLPDDERAAWGRYYDSAPRVMAGEIPWPVPAPPPGVNGVGPALTTAGLAGGLAPQRAADICLTREALALCSGDR